MLTRIHVRLARYETARAALLVSAAALLGCSADDILPTWVRAFGYTASQLHEIEIGDYGYPYLPVSVDEVSVMLPFDTGNTTGISLSPTLFDRLQLTVSGTHDRLTSAGEVVSTLRIGRCRSVSIAGRDLGPQPIYEFEHPGLSGLAGPDFLLGGHFTLDYGARLFASSNAPLAETIPGYQPVPLVRSPRHPTLLLVHGEIEGRQVLIELDTGKSRTVVNPQLAAELGLERRDDGFSIRHLDVGGWSFTIANAKGVDQTGIDTELSEPILAGIGSDILAGFTWTADYSTDTLWLPLAAPP